MDALEFEREVLDSILGTDQYGTLIYWLRSVLDLVKLRPQLDTSATLPIKTHREAI